MIHWFFVHTGTYNESGPYYGFFSGFGSDIGELAIIGGLVALVRHHNCHVKGCKRLGRKVEGTPYVACHVHHPSRQAEGDTARNVTAETIQNAVR